MLGALAGLGARIAGRGLVGGVGGYTSSRITGSDHDREDVGLDVLAGIIGLSGFGKKSIYDDMPDIFKRAGKRIQSKRAVKYLPAIGAMGPIGMTWSGDSPSAKAAVVAHKAASRPIQGPPVPPGFVWGGGAGATGGGQSSMLGGMDMSSLMVAPVKVNYKQGAAPVFNKSLKDFLADKQLAGLVNQNIFQMNQPLMAANQAEQRQRARDLAQNESTSAAVQAEHAKRIAASAEDSRLLQERAANRSKLLAEQTAAATGEVPLTYMSGEAATAQGQASVAAANETALSDALIDRLASAGQTYLSDLKDASAAQGRVDSKAIISKADETIKGNVAQIRANQSQRGTLLSSLAQEQYKNALELHNLGIQQYNADEDRKFNVANTNADALFKARSQNATTNASLVTAEAEAQSAAATEAAKPAPKTDFQKRGAKVLEQLAKDLAKAQTKMYKVKVGEDSGKEVPWSSRPEGKKQIRIIKERIAKAKKTYGL